MKLKGQQWYMKVFLIICVLGATLFLIAINDITSVLPPSVSAFFYVDDFIMYAAISHISCLLSLLQSTIHATSKWLLLLFFQNTCYDIHPSTFYTSTPCVSQMTQPFLIIPHLPL